MSLKRKLRMAKGKARVKAPSPKPTKKLLPPDSVKTEAAEQLFVKVAEDLLRENRELYDSLTLTEQETVLQWLLEALVEEEPMNAVHDVLWEIDYSRKPVGIEEFVRNEYYMGKVFTDEHGHFSMFDPWMDDLKAVHTPGSKVVEWYFTGSIGVGKCCHERTYVNCGDGFRTIRDAVEAKTPEIQAESGLRSVQEYHDEGEIDTIRMVTKHGHVLEGSPQHRVRVLDGLEIGWKRLADLTTGDCVLEAPAQRLGTFPVSLTVAELLGWFIAEGVVNDSSGYGVRFCLAESELQYVADLARRAAADELCCRAYVCDVGSYVELRGGNVEGYFSGFGRSHDKYVPVRIMQGSREVICAFLRGLFSGDGYSGDSACEFTTVSARLAEEVRVLLTALGYYVSLTCGIAAYTKNGKRTVTGAKYNVRVVGPESIQRFAEEIGFVHTYKQGMLESRCQRYNSNCDHSFAFALSKGAALAFREMQPSFSKTNNPLGLTKRTSPRGKIARLVHGQRCTLRLLREVRDAGGVLSEAHRKLADGELLFDVVSTVEKSRSHCYDLSVRGDPSYVSNGFISHNTSIAMASMAYKLYELSCLRNPAAYYSLMPKSLIVFGLFSATKRLIADTGYFKLRGYLDASPYFREKFPRSAKIDSKCDFAPTTGKNVQVISGSQGFHALGQDVFAFAIDEVNFMRERKDKEQAKMVGQAYEIFNSVSTRLRSRFMREGGTVPGIMLLMSSRNSQTSFLEAKMKLSKNDPTIFISDYALWDVHPKHRYCGKRFTVEVGDRVSQSRILKPKEEVREGAKTVSVPIEYKKQFEEDTDQSLRDIAGIATFNISPFIRDRQSIHDAIRPNLKHPFKRQEVTLDYTDDLLLSDYFNVVDLCKRVESKWIPRINPSAPRFLHVDLALSGDCGGFAMGHVSGMLKQSKYDMDTGLTEEKCDPFVIIDLMLRIVPPKGSQIDLSKIRAFILFLKKCGFKVTRVSFDGFQSADSIQILRKRKIDTTLLSVDKTDKPYSSLRSAHFDRRIGTYRYDPYIDEVLDLEQDLNAGKTRKLCKIDHPAKASKGGKGSKDVSDAVAGVIWHCIEDERAHKDVPVFDVEDLRKKTKVIDPNPETMAAHEKDDQKRRVGGNDYDWEKLRENVNA